MGNFMGYQAGERVWPLLACTKWNPCKLQSSWDGPYKIRWQYTQIILNPTRELLRMSSLKEGSVGADED
jgi:hypothetical protein